MEQGRTGFTATSSCQGLGSAALLDLHAAVFTLCARCPTPHSGRSIAAAEEVEVADLMSLNPSLNTSNGAIYLGGLLSGVNEAMFHAQRAMLVSAQA